MNPRIDINLDKIKHNAEVLLELCRPYNLSVAAVTKGFCGKPEIAEVLVEAGVRYLADSRLENFVKMKDLPVEKLLLRLPMISQAKEVVTYADISLNSELETIKALNAAAEDISTTHKIILMLDLGDLREGIFDAVELEKAAREIKGLSNIDLIGVGTNLTCYGGVIPNEDNLGQLVETASKIEEILGKKLEIISGGNSSSVYLLMNNKMPKGINHIRLGEAILLGSETAYGDAIPNTHQDAFQLVAEVIELKEKPSVPIGEIGRDAFGNVPTFVDKGTHKRGILAVGKQDITTHPITPVDQQIEILGGSSDHLIVDFTKCDKEYKVGDEVVFNIGYGAMLALMTSEYIHKNYVSVGRFV